MATILAFEFAVFVAVLFALFMALLSVDRRMKMDQTEVLAKVAALKASIDALIALPGPTPTPDLQPIGDAVDAVKAEVDAKVAASTPPA